MVSSDLDFISNICSVSLVSFSTNIQIWDIENGFVLAYPQLLTGSELYKIKIWQFASKTTKCDIKVYGFFRFRLYFKHLQCKFSFKLLKLFSPMVSGWAVGRVVGKSLSELYFRNRKV